MAYLAWCGPAPPRHRRSRRFFFFLGDGLPDDAPLQRIAHLTSESKTRRPQPRGILAVIRRLLLTSPRILLDSLRFLLPTAIFFIKFLDWWYSPGSPARAFSTSPSEPALPPPRMLHPQQKGIPFDSKQYGKCPVCKDPFRNATALPSGYVFCYRCVYDHVDRQGSCPVTLMPVKLWQLRKVLI